MCGIAGVVRLSGERPVQIEDLKRMLAEIRHRGPDGFGIYLDADAGLGNARLSIIDLTGGAQPICNEDGSLWIVYNGEVFNYIELRAELERRGHYFSTHTDTEVILHLFEEKGSACLDQLNGQFALAIWDAARHKLFLARDRMGVRPLFFTQVAGCLVFASEIKSLLAFPGVRADIDPASLSQVFTYWSCLSPRTAFRDIWELPPGHCAWVGAGGIRQESYWSLDFSAEEDHHRSVEDVADELEALLVDAACIRLRADVPVGAYLSGGLDSSLTTAIIRKRTNRHLDTFSIAFSAPEFDESPYQRRMAEFLGTEHQVVFTRHEDIGAIFPQVIWHTETPILRTAPAPMYLLSQCVRESRYKVVLTGEGADELLAGYDIFKEARIRRFWANQPQSQSRPALFGRIYPDVLGKNPHPAYLARFFGENLQDVASPGYSHQIRWRNTARARRFFSSEMHQYLGASQDLERDLCLPEAFSNWKPLSRAQYLEMTTFLSPYLLSSQGDRMAMAHSVEGRFPFLDHRVIEFCNQLPAHLKLLGLQEKYLLKRIARKWLPPEIVSRRKRPYRAPIYRSFFTTSPLEYVAELLSPESLAQTGYFDPEAVGQLVASLKTGKRLGETDDMALAGILSTQLLHHLFMDQSPHSDPLKDEELLKVCIYPG